MSNRLSSPIEEAINSTSSTITTNNTSSDMTHLNFTTHGSSMSTTRTTSSVVTNLNNFTTFENKKKIVFICVTGQLSRLELSNKISTLFRPLQDAGFNLDIHLVLTQTKYTNRKRKGRIQNEFPAVFDTFSSAYDYLSQHGIRLVSNTNFPTRPISLSSNIPLNANYAKTIGEDRTMNHARMYAVYDRCWEQWKQTNIDTYEFAIRIREDVGFSTPQHISSLLELLRQSPSNRTVLATDCRHQNGVNDRMAIISTPAAEAYFTAPYRKYIVSNETRVGGSEKFLKSVYIKSGINVVATSTLRFVIKLQQNKASGKSELASSQELVLRCQGGNKQNAQLKEKLIQQLDAVNSMKQKHRLMHVMRQSIFGAKRSESAIKKPRIP